MVCLFLFKDNICVFYDMYLCIFKICFISWKKYCIFFLWNESNILIDNVLLSILLILLIVFFFLYFVILLRFYVCGESGG